MARRSDGPWVLSSNMMMRNNSHERDNSSFGGCGGDASRGDIFDMKGYACCGLSNTDRITITCPHLSRSLVAALCNTQDSTADVARTLARCKFSPRLPGLTKLVSKFGKEGCWRKALGVYESLHILNVIPDTAITNAAISACDKGGQWQKSLELFHSMEKRGLQRDAITYSAAISSLAKGKQWGTALQVFEHMQHNGIEADVVTCCSLINALEKGGQWELAEQLFLQMCIGVHDNEVTLHSILQAAGAGHMLGPGELAALSAADRAMAAADDTRGNNPLLNVLATSPNLTPDQQPATPVMQEMAPRNPFLQTHSGELSGPQKTPIEEGVVSHITTPPMDTTPTPTNTTTLQDEAGVLGSVLHDLVGTDTRRAPRSPPPSHLATPSPGISPTASPGANLQRWRRARSIGSATSFSSVAESPERPTPLPLTPGADWLVGTGPLHTKGALSNLVASGGTDHVRPGLYRSVSDVPSLLTARMGAPVGPPQPLPLDVLARLGNRPSAASSGFASKAVALLLAFDAARGQHESTQGDDGAPHATALMKHVKNIRFRCATRVAPNRVCVNALLAAYARARPVQWAKSLALLEIMWEGGEDVQPDVVTYNSVLKALGNAHQLDFAVRLFKDLCARGIDPSITTYGIMLAAAADAGDLGVLHDTWRTLVTSGLEVNSSCINTYITGLAKLDEINEAEQLLRTLTTPTARIKPMGSTVNAMLAAYARAGLHDRVTTLFSAMSTMGLQPNSETYHTLVASCVGSGHWLDALNTLERLCNGGGINGAVPSASSFAMVLDSLRRAMAGFADNQSDRILLASKGTELFQCYQRTSSRGDVDVTDPAPHAAALRLFAQAQQWQRVVDVDRMRQHQRVVLVESAVPSVVVAYCRLGHVHEATNTLLTALKENTAGSVQPSLAAQILVVSAALGPPGTSSEVWSALTAAATSTTAAAAAAPRFPPSVLLHYAVAELVALGSTDACVAVMQWVAEAGVVPHAHSSAFAWQLVGALMEAQLVAVAVQTCSHGHDMGVLGWYVLPVDVPVVTAEQGGTLRITPVQNHVMCGLAAVFAWLLRLSHALQAGKRVEVDTLSIVILYDNEGDHMTSAQALQQLVAQLLEEGPRPLVMLLLGSNHDLVCPPLPVSTGTIESHGERTLQISTASLVAWLTSVGALAAPLVPYSPPSSPVNL